MNAPGPLFRSVGAKVRNLGLTIHVASSVGWCGAVAVFLALAIVGVTHRDPQSVGAAYFAMRIAAWYVILPLAFASLLSGVAQSLLTAWGLFRHYWVVVKLGITVVATVVLLLKLPAIDLASRVALSNASASADFGHAHIELIVHAAGGIALLLAATVVAVYKPWGPLRRST